MIAALPALHTPPAGDAVGLLPVIVLSAAFIILMVLDLSSKGRPRWGLATFALVALAAAFALVVWGWFDTEHGGKTVYFGSVYYDRLAMFFDGVLIVAAFLTVLISP